MNKDQKIAQVARLYSALITFYPKKYVRMFGEEMVQTFKDHYADVCDPYGNVPLSFWVGVIADDAKGIGKEYLSSAKSLRNIPQFLLIVLCLLICSTLMTIRISPIFMVIMMLLIVSTTVFFIKKLSRSERKSTKSVKYVWVKNGVLYGILLGLFLLPMNTVNMLTIQNVLSFQAVPIGLLILAGIPLLLLMSGYSTGRKSKQVKQGLFSGLLTACIGAGVIVVSSAILLFVFWQFASTNASNVSHVIGEIQYSWANVFSEFHWSVNLSANLITTILMLVFGGILGCIGGLIGKKSTSV